MKNIADVRTIFLLAHFGLAGKTDDQTQSRPQEKAARFL
jgi:hypothetical protein